MIQYRKEDIFKLDVEAIVNTVNCIGVMGKGLALFFKKKYPENFNIYKEICDDGLLKPGKVLLTKTNSIQNPKYIINFPTKDHWKNKSKMEYIEQGLDDLVIKINQFKIQSIAIPALGCGLGGLNWIMVKKIIEEKLNNLDIKIIVIEPL